MKLKVQLVVCADDGREEHVQEVATFEKDCQRSEHLGLTLAEAKEGVPVVLEQKPTILWKPLYLLASLKDSPGLGEA